MLAQGSGFATRGVNGAFALVSGHVAAPHRWRRLFGNVEFLGAVRDAHCETRLHTRKADGDVDKHIESAALQAGFAHSALDVAAFALRDVPYTLKLRGAPLENGEELCVAGHVLHGVDGADGVVPTTVHGRYVTRDGARGFAQTDSPCELGMCGGPVIDRHGECVGILEGVVPRVAENAVPNSDMHAKIAGCAAFIGAQELRLFLLDVEKALATPRAAS